MATGGTTTLIHDSDPVETTPLVSNASSASRRIKSYSNAPHLSPKRRLYSKTRLSKALDKLHISTVKPTDQIHNNDDDEGPPLSITPLPSPSSASYDDNKWTSSDSINHRASSPGSSRHKSPRPTLASRISLTLENSGSVARDHLASERTFLAYVRTSLAIASAGVALVQLFTASSANPHHSPDHWLHYYVRPLGAMTVVMGLIILVIGVVRYFSIQAALTKGHFPVARVVAAFISMTLAVLVVLTFGILATGRPRSL